MNLYLWIILLLIVGTGVIDSIADILNLKSFIPSVPDEFREIHTPDKHLHSQTYLSTNVRSDLFKRAVLILLSITFILAGGFNWLDGFARGFGLGTIATGLIFIGALSLMRGLIQLPFSLYDTFVIEERFGFNRTTPRVFVQDLFKGLFLSALLGLPLIAVLLYFFDRVGPWAWLYAWIFFSAFQIIIGFLAPVIIMPLFNQFKPLPEGELKNSIQEYVRGQKFTISGIYTMDGSLRSTKANAFFTGFGRFRRLVLFDTLVSKHTIEELVAVFAHEVGHFKLGHIPKSMVVSLVSSAVLFYFFSLFINNRGLFEAFRMENLSIYASLTFISILFGPILRLLSVLPNLMSRKFEFEADEFAARTYGHPESLVAALKKLSTENLAHLTPHPLKVLLDYSHPPILQRIHHLKSVVR